MLFVWVSSRVHSTHIVPSMVYLLDPISFSFDLFFSPLLLPRMFIYLEALNVFCREASERNDQIKTTRIGIPTNVIWCCMHVFKTIKDIAYHSKGIAANITSRIFNQHSPFPDTYSINNQWIRQTNTNTPKESITQIGSRNVHI